MLHNEVGPPMEALIVLFGVAVACPVAIMLISKRIEKQPR